MTAAVLVAVAVLLAWPTVPSARSRSLALGTVSSRPSAESAGWVERGRPLWALSAFVGVVSFGSGLLGVALGVGAALAVWVVVGRAESGATRRTREAVRRDLPHLVDLLAGALESGLSVAAAIELVTAALPGAAADELTQTATRLRLGVPAVEVWQQLSERPGLGPLGRAFARAHESGSSVAGIARQLADDLTEEAHLGVEERARAVGVRAAVPLGLCLLPSFLVLGVVPLVVGAAGAIAW